MDVSPDYVFAQVGKLYVELSVLKTERARLVEEINRLTALAEPQKDAPALKVATGRAASTNPG